MNTNTIALTEQVKTAMRRAYDLGQRYWQQADSDFTSQHKKADETAAKFAALSEETCAAIAALEAEPTIPEGWGFSSADFSLQASGVSDYGGVMLVRVGVHRSRWHLLSEAQKEETALYVSGTGKTIAEAIADAAKDCAPLPATPPKD